VPERGDAVALSPSGNILLIAPRDGPTQVWDLKNRAHPTNVTSLSGATGTTVFDVAFSPDGRTAATAESDGTTVWSLVDPEHPVQSYRLHGHQHDVYAVTFADEGQALLTGGPEGIAMTWSVPGERDAVTVWSSGPFRGAPDIVGYSRDSRTLITAGGDDDTYLWDNTDPGRPVRLSTLSYPAGGTTQVALSPDGTTLIRSTWNHPPSLWDITDRSFPRMLGSLGNVPAHVNFAPNGRTVIRHALEHGADLCDLPRRDHPVRIASIGPLANDVGNWARFSPDGRTLAIAGPESTQLWNVADPSHPAYLAAINGAGGAVVFRPDGRILAGVGPNAVLSLWDITRLDRPVRIGQVASDTGGGDVAFTRDGRFAVTGSSDATAIIWNVTDPTTPQKIGQANGHAGSVSTTAPYGSGPCPPSSRTSATRSRWPARLPDPAPATRTGSAICPTSRKAPCAESPPS
jgi:WD40 repeat protein